MSNKLAIIFAVILIVILMIDLIAFDGAVLIMLGKKLVLLIEYIAFWR